MNVLFMKNGRMAYYHNIQWAVDREIDPTVNFMMKALHMIIIMQLAVDLSQRAGLILAHLTCFGSDMNLWVRNLTISQ